MPKPTNRSRVGADRGLYAELLTRERTLKARTFRQVRQAKKRADYWRKRWQSHPETMGANLNRINAARQAKATERTDRLLAVLADLPQAVQSWELRPLIAAALLKAGHLSDKPAVERFLSAIRRRKLIAFDAPTIRWQIKQTPGV